MPSGSAEAQQAAMLRATSISEPKWVGMEEASPFRRCVLIGSTASRVVGAAGLGALVVAPLAAASNPFLPRSQAGCQSEKGEGGAQVSPLKLSPRYPLVKDCLPHSRLGTRQGAGTR